MPSGSVDALGANSILLRGNIFKYTGIGLVTNLIITNNWIEGQMTIGRPESTVITQNIFTTISPVNNIGSTIGRSVVQNRIILDNSTGNSELSSSHTQFNNCLTYNYGTGSFNISAATTNMVTNNMLINTNPLFTINDNQNFNAETDNLTLQAGSPAIASGINNEDMGLFGNNYPFSNFGNATGYPSIKIISNTAALPQNGIINVIVSGQSH